MKKTVISGIILTLASFSLYPTAYACSCMEVQGYVEAAKTHDRILVVELNNSWWFFNRKKFQVNIVDVIKGELNPKLNAIYQGQTSCDPGLQDDQQWLVFLDNKTTDIQLGWCQPDSLIENLMHTAPNWRDAISP